MRPTEEKIQKDPSDLPIYLFKQGNNCEAYRYFGAHLETRAGESGVVFRVWAPHAAAISVVGDFNSWKPGSHPMRKVDGDSVWELFIPGVKEYDVYKYCVTTRGGDLIYKADPYANRAMPLPETSSVVDPPEKFRWTDAAYRRNKLKQTSLQRPVNIYEVHAGSWKRHDDGSYLSYEELAAELIPYVKDMGYTHIEFMPLMEYPYDPSWGYQVTGYYAPTHRYGSPEQLRMLVNACHAANIGVILDWVPAHFPKDSYGLYEFDGTCCYELSDPAMREHPDWGTRIYDYAKPEVRSFLISNVCYWLREFHIDGIRVDAVSSMLYLNYARRDGEWTPNRDGGNINLGAVAFLQKLNTTLLTAWPGCMTIAEESSAYPGVTKPPYDGGLGFSFKWDMGFMHDTLDYLEIDPYFRKYHHDKLTFSLMYAFSENYILPFSHDEVVHGKHSMLDKQPGDLWKKFAGLRALYGYTMAHPGKKLLFMGGEFGHFIEWKYDDQLDWFLLLYENHPQVQQCCKRLNEIYRTTPALYQIDDSWDGFQWIQANDSDNSIVAFLRTDKRGNSLLCVTNFTPVFHPQYRIGLPQMGTLTECFNTDRKEYGGSNQYNNWAIRTEEEQLQDFQYSCDICVPPLATVYFTYQRDPLPEKAKKARVIPEIADVPPKKASQTAKKPQPLPEKSAGKANSISIG
ncbi:MAG: 1,4-alpha-glucan branching protein GlgB [Clostridiales bacterium]|nr:1,4-alpha-glucan branching protein GlgB [Clostridiales bacterium]